MSKNRPRESMAYTPNHAGKPSAAQSIGRRRRWTNREAAILLADHYLTGDGRRRGQGGSPAEIAAGGSETHFDRERWVR